MSRHYRNHPEEPIRHDWTEGGRRSVPLGLKDVEPVPVTAEAVRRYKLLLKQKKEAGEENPN